MTFYILLRKEKQSKGGSFPIALRFRWNGKLGYIKTGLSATKKQITETKDGALRLTDSFLNRILDDRMGLYNKIILEMGLSANAYSAPELAKYIIEKADEITAPQPIKGLEKISLTDFAANYIKEQKELNVRKGLQSTGSAGNIQVAMNSLHKFAGKDNLLFDDITVDFLNKYCHWMLTTQGRDGKGVKGRGLQLNLGHIKHLFRMAARVYNNNRERVMMIFSPFDGYTIPKPPLPKKRAITLDEMRRIRDYCLVDGRAELARDMFLLSFYLIGMNSVDLYTCNAPAGGWVTYNRSKTKHRRDDEAEFSLKVPPEALPILEKYPDKTKLLNVYKQYATIGTFSAALNKGLKHIGSAIDIPNLTFYAARHTWATFAENNAGIDRYTVHQCLNHSDEKMKITGRYIKTDWRPINRANRQVLDFLASGVEMDEE
jgi:integrase